MSTAGQPLAQETGAGWIAAAPVFHKLPLTAEALAEPVSPGSPAGPFLLYDPIYDAIRAARSADQPELPQGIWQADLKRADWDEAIRLA